MNTTQEVLEADNEINVASHLGWKDFIDGLLCWRIWLMLSYQDIRLRYRRSAIGPFWQTLNTAIITYSMGFLYSYLFHINIRTYFPYLTLGIVAWNFISYSINELTDAFVSSEGIIRQMKLPYTLYIHRVVCRNLFVFLHNVIVIIPVIILFPNAFKIDLNLLMLIPNLVLLYVNAFAYGIILSLLGVRYRDLSQIIKNMVQVIFFITPVMWSPVMLSAKMRLIADVNPLYAYLQLIRTPLQGASMSTHEIAMVFILTCVGIILALWAFVKYRAKIIYWV